MWRRVHVGLAMVILLMASCSTEEGSSDAVEARASTTVTTSTTTSPVTTTSPTTAAPDPRTPVLLDYSPTVSDIGALVFVASHPDLRLVAVTLPGTGESYCGPGVAHTRGVLEELGLGDVPVACGPEDPTTGWNAFPTSWRVGANELELPEADPNQTRPAPELIADVISGSDKPIELLAVAPLTNLALALDIDPTLAESVGGITIMGGAVDVPGNVIRNEVAEWNIWVDPTAAGIVFSSGAPVTLVPLDATNHLPANRVFFEALDAAAESLGAVLVRDLIAGDPFWLSGGFYFWDELAAAVLVDESIVEFETRRLVVDDAMRETKGWTREDQAGDDVRVAVSADRLGFEQLYLDTLVGDAAELGYLEATDAEAAYFEEIEAISGRTQEAIDRVFATVAAELGVESDAEGGFVDLVEAALPRIFAGPWQEQIAALSSVDVPPDIAVLHFDWVEQLAAFAAAEEEVTAALAAGGFEGLESLFDPVAEACAAIEEAAAIRLLSVDLDCF